MTDATKELRIAKLWIVTITLAGATWLAPASGQEKSTLPKHYVLDKVRVFYAIEGGSAVPLTDADSNGVPDHVEDVAKQVWAAHRLFCEVLGFPDPLQSERYPGVTCIEVGIRDRGDASRTAGFWRGRHAGRSTPCSKAVSATSNQGVMDVLRRRAPPVGRFQVTKAATVPTSRVPSTPEQNAAP